jgi:hypothetical protein
MVQPRARPSSADKHKSGSHAKRSDYQDSASQEVQRITGEMGAPIELKQRPAQHQPKVRCRLCRRCFRLWIRIKRLFILSRRSMST